MFPTLSSSDASRIRPPLQCHSLPTQHLEDVVSQPVGHQRERPLLVGRPIWPPQGGVEQNLYYYWLLPSPPGRAQLATHYLVSVVIIVVVVARRHLRHRRILSRRCLLRHRRRHRRRRRNRRPSRRRHHRQLRCLSRRFVGTFAFAFVPLEVGEEGFLAVVRRDGFCWGDSSSLMSALGLRRDTLGIV